MRKSLTCLVVLAFLLFAMGVMAQTSPSSGQQNTTSTTTTTTTTQQATPDTSGSTHGTSHAKNSATGSERSVEGCVMKEASDFFLIPSKGNPIELQASAGQDLSAHAGHKVKVRGTESSLTSAAGAGETGGTTGVAASTTTTTTGTQSSAHSVNEPAGKNSSSNAGEASGASNNLHRLASKQMMVANVDHVADTCPVNWNPKVSGKSGSSKY